jgi:hypothetical protein
LQHIKIIVIKKLVAAYIVKKLYQYVIIQYHYNIKSNNMLKKFIPVIAIICFVIFSSVVLTGCPASTDKTTTSDTSSAMQDSSGTMSAPMDTSMKMDTSTMDTASTRPVKNPN